MFLEPYVQFLALGLGLLLLGAASAPVVHSMQPPSLTSLGRWPTSLVVFGVVIFFATIPSFAAILAACIVGGAAVARVLASRRVSHPTIR